LKSHIYTLISVFFNLQFYKTVRSIPIVSCATEMGKGPTLYLNPYTSEIS